MTSTSMAGRIAAIAREFLKEAGPQAVTMRPVAQKAGITAMAIYRYYPNREALLDAVADAEFHKMAEHLEGHGKTRGGSSRLLHLMDCYVSYALANPKIYEFMFSQKRPGARAFPEDFRERRSPTLNLLADAVSSEMENGRFRRDDVWEVALALWAHVHGYVALFRAGRIAVSEEEFKRLCERSLRRMIRGLKS